MSGYKRFSGGEQEKWGASMWGSFLVLGRRIISTVVHQKFILHRIQEPFSREQLPVIIFDIPQRTILFRKENK